MVASLRMVMNPTFCTANAATTTTTTNYYPKAVGCREVECKLWDKKKPDLLSLTTKLKNYYPTPFGIRSVGRCCSTSSELSDQIVLCNPEAVAAGKLKKNPIDRRGTIAVIEILLDDNNGVIWDELKKLSVDLSTSNHFSSTGNMLKSILDFLVRHHKHWVHKDTSRKVYTWSEVPLLRACQWAEYDIHDVRKRGKWLRWLISGHYSNTVFVTVLACVDTEVGWDEYMHYVRNEEHDCMADILSKLSKDDLGFSECVGNFVRMNLQPGLLLYASNRSDFGRSPPPIFLKAGPSHIERRWEKIV